MMSKAVLALCAVLTLGACTNPYDPGQRAVGGGLLGAGAGAAIGGLAGGGRGAALGALIGGGAGAVGGAATTPTAPARPYYQQGYQQGGYYPPPPPAEPVSGPEPLAVGGRYDLADTAAGVYYGSVISDARGSGRSNVSIFVTKTGPNTISVTSDYGRLPPFTIRLTRAMNTIQQVGTSVVFLLNLSRDPRGLDINDDDASWSGSKG